MTHTLDEANKHRAIVHANKDWAHTHSNQARHLEAHYAGLKDARQAIEEMQ